jgi:hypothetical protein
MDIQREDTQHKETWGKDTHHNYIRYNNIGIITVGIRKFSITKLEIMTISITITTSTLRIRDTMLPLWHHVFVALNVIMPSVIIWSVVAPTKLVKLEPVLLSFLQLYY